MLEDKSGGRSERVGSSPWAPAGIRPLESSSSPLAPRGPGALPGGHSCSPRPETGDQMALVSGAVPILDVLSGCQMNLLLFGSEIMGHLMCAVNPASALCLCPRKGWPLERQDGHF